MSEGLEATVAAAFAGETGTTPVVNMSGADASTATTTNSTTSSTAANSKFYTEEDLAKVRSQEKDKLYPQIEQLKDEVSSLRKEREEEAARLAAAAAEKESAEAAMQKEQKESELEVRELLKVKEQEWQEQLERERQERERAFALLEREKTFADLQAYRQQTLESEREAIIPELLDLVSGNTREEIDASIAGLRERSAKILESAQSAMQNARREMKGTSITTPPAGPLETNTEQRQFTADEIAAMPMNDYAKYRSRLLSPKAQGQTRGLFG